MDINNSTNTLEKIDSIIKGFFYDFRRDRGLISTPEEYFFNKASSLFCSHDVMIEMKDLPFNVSADQIRLISAFIHALDFTDLYLSCRGQDSDCCDDLSNISWDLDFAKDYLQYFSIDSLVYFDKKLTKNKSSCFDPDLYEEIFDDFNGYDEIEAMKYTYLHGLCKRFGQSRKILVNEFDETELTVIFMDIFKNIASPYIKGYFYVPKEDEDSDLSLPPMASYILQ